MAIISKKQPRPITVEAFRFVQLQSPKLYTAKWATASLVTHPDPNKSAILGQSSKAAIKPVQRLDRLDKKAIKESREIDDAFQPYSTLSQLRNLNTSLYSFIFWLSENRGQLEQESLAKQTENIQPLHEEQRLELWDNLLYQTQVESSSALVEAAIRLLQADHFLTYYRAQRETFEGTNTFPIEALQRAAMASVVIPHELFKLENQPSTPRYNQLDAQSKAILADQLEIALLDQRIQHRTQAVTEIQAAEKRYIHDNQQEYQEALQQHEGKVAALLKEAQTISNQSGSIKICGQDIEPFLFQPENTWDDAYLQQQLSTESLAIYQAIKTNHHRHIADTRQAIEQSIGELHHQKAQITQKHAPKTLIHQGIQIPLRNRPMNNAYVFKAVPVEGKKGHYSIYATQYYEQPATKVHSIKAVLQASGGASVEASSKTPIYETTHYVTLQLFKEGVALKEDELFAINGNFETEDAAYNNSFQYDNLKPDQATASDIPRDDRPRPGIPVPNIFGVMGVKIAEFKKVNQTLCCYTEGEVSHIENILAREYKERETRNLIRSELTTEQTRERESEDLKDTTTTERHEIQSEISLMMQEDQNNSASASASAGGAYDFGSGSINFNASGSLSTSTSSSSSSNFSESEAYAKEVTQRAMKRLVEKTTYKRTSKMIREFEEKNKHGFDNRKGSEHVTGVYRWVDKIYKNDLVNYGKRLMYELMLPEPARNYKHLLESNSKKDQGQSCDSTVLTKPLSPVELANVNRYWDITVSNFDTLVAYYGLEIDKYPVRHIKIARSFSENFYQTGAQVSDSKPLHASKDFEFEIPKDYVCKGFDCRFTAKRHGANQNLFGDLIIGTSSMAFNNENVQTFKRGSTPTTVSFVIPFPPPPTTHYITIPAFDPVEEYLPIAVACQDVGNFAMTIWADCEIKDEAFDEFRAQMFAQMWESYKEMLQIYEDAKYEQCLRKQQEQAAAQANEKPSYGVPSATARAIEKRELKRLVIEQIMQKYYDYRVGFSNLPIGANYYQADPCNNTLNLYTSDALLNERLHYARFLEQAFEWEIMAYTFLPYYWNDEDSWGDLLSIEASADHIFKAFLQSGMANVILPVKPGLEKSVAFLLETGRLWKGDGFILDGQNDLYPAIDEQLHIEVDNEGNEVQYDDKGTPIPKIEATWETRIPSTLTIVQDYSNPLNDQGLPCFCEEDPSNRIGYSPTIDGYNKLEGLIDGSDG